MIWLRNNSHIAVLKLGKNVGPETFQQSRKKNGPKHHLQNVAQKHVAWFASQHTHTNKRRKKSHINESLEWNFAFLEHCRLTDALWREGFAMTSPLVVHIWHFTLNYSPRARLNKERRRSSHFRLYLVKGGKKEHANQIFPLPILSSVLSTFFIWLL